MKDAIRLALEEARRQGSRFDRRTLIVLALVGLVTGVVVALAPPPAPSPGTDLFTLESAPDSLFRDAARSDHRLRVLDGDGSRFQAGNADLYLATDAVHFDRDNEASLAALEVLESAVRRWMDQRLLAEADDAAAFPLSITLVFEPRTLSVAPNPESSDPGPPAPPAPPTDPGTEEPGPGSEGGPGGSDDPPEAPSTPNVLDTAEPTGAVQRNIRPEQVEPPFPIRSLLLTFAYVLPAGLLAQVHASNLHAERVRRRGVLLLSAPLTSRDILIGKSLPALALTVLIAAVVTVALGAGILGFLASLSFLGFLFTLTTFLAVLARSPRELSLLQVAATTLLNAFLFLPAMFPSLPPVAFLSPVHVVAAGIRGDPVTMGQFLYATLPLGLGALALGALAIGMTREELLFSVRSGTARLLDALGAVTTKRRRVLLAGILVVPFVFVAELMVFVLAAILGIGAALGIFLGLSVVLEELAKGAVVWAGRRPGKHLPETPITPTVLGILAGAGFWVGEKSYLILTLVGFEDLPFAREALLVLGTGPGIIGITIPLFLHVATGLVMAHGAARGRGWMVAAFFAAVALHFGYDAVLLGGYL